MNYCPNCGTKLQEGAKYCINCGTCVETNPQPAKSEKDCLTGYVLSVVAITLAGASLLLTFCGFGTFNVFFTPITLVLGVLGCVFAGMALKKGKNPKAKTSLVLSIVAMSIAVLIWPIIVAMAFIICS